MSTVSCQKGRCGTSGVCLGVYEASTIVFVMMGMSATMAGRTLSEDGVYLAEVFVSFPCMNSSELQSYTTHMGLWEHRQANWVKMDASFQQAVTGPRLRSSGP